ncbi:hypothetical protein EUGRSUZ_E03204 [Eucalyptus grandis]|uniref:Uncharacterized protein n=2 Tax=Eucalyptus grandis TaxID=71139 RepID=A0ACC3KZ48_EUCGR|nr:hypothetical protein EUGRSUZ_E03204 [Eucalyptus grandis]
MVRYQVFLSFRGPETRDNLVQYLYDQLKRNGVVVFRDSEEIEDGQEISKTIEDAIESSDICVPVFSQDFASSAACLKEVAQMVKLGKKIRPIFFFVEPCIVCHRLGTYGKSFAEHRRKNRYRESTIKEWEDALEKIGGILGPEFKQADLKAALRPALKAALRPALREIGHGLEFKKAALEVALESAVEAALQPALEAALQAAEQPALEAAQASLQEQTDVIQEPKSKKAALEAALGENGVMKRPEFKEAALEEMGGANGRFYNDLFSGRDISTARSGPPAARSSRSRLSATHRKKKTNGEEEGERFKKLEGFVTGLVDLLHMDEKEKTKNLVGLDRAVPQMVRKLGFNYQDGQVVRKKEITGRMVFVVRGIAGVGKTTLAREVYNKIRHLFNGCSFLEDIRYKTTEKDVVSLQNNLIRDLTGGRCQEVKYSEDGTKKIKHLQGDRVLIVLDNVENSEQIKPFANEVTWFGLGSIIILTSRRADIITHFKVPENSKPEELCKLDHQVSSMNKDDALELFYKHAVIKPDDLPTNLSEEITYAVGRLPLAIEIVGKYLCGKSNKIWKEAPDRLKGDLEKQLEILYKENYDSLCENTKEIFLDIACFFREVKMRNPYYMWDAQKRYPDFGFDKLQELSFVNIGEENELRMHNQLEIFGRKTVKQNCEDPWERSRLWDYEDVRTVLRGKQVESH